MPPKSSPKLPINGQDVRSLWPAGALPDVAVSVHRMDLPNHQLIDTHSHKQGQLFSIDCGISVVETPAGSWMFPPRRCGWIPPQHLHSVRSGTYVRGWSLFLTPELCEELPQKPMVLSLSPLLEQIVLRIATWDTDSPTESSRAKLLEVLVDEIRMAQEQPLHLPMPTDPRLKQLVGELAKNPETDRPLQAWARCLGMSERSLQRDFQREVGMTIGQWRQQLRILVALEKLSSGLSVTDTCFAVGYNSVSAFIKAFRQTVGLTPLEYVKKH